MADVPPCDGAAPIADQRHAPRQPSFWSYRRRPQRTAVSRTQLLVATRGRPNAYETSEARCPCCGVPARPACKWASRRRRAAITTRHWGVLPRARRRRRLSVAACCWPRAGCWGRAASRTAPWTGSNRPRDWQPSRTIRRTPQSILGEIARLRANKGEIDQALQLHEEALRVYEALGDRRERAITLGDIARLRADKGEIDQALQLLEEALHVYEALGDRRERAITLGHIARLGADKGEVDQALQLLEGSPHDLSKTAR